ncbi:MAG: MerR family transcriptional regulator [Clostridiales bacterium]|nr:MerR family transcriptional regulator [Clostridiales bacterium]
MLKIGDLSKITNISVKTIRFYEEKGLICPIEVDRWTGYRYYDESSVNKLCEIIYLKNLGFSLKEIANFDKNSIKEKTVELELKIKQLKHNIKSLSTIKKEGDYYIMKTFLNDEQVVGKWKKIGNVKEKTDFFAKKLEKNDIFDYKELYFLPNGEEYWVFGWTKGVLYLKDRKLPYEILDGKLFIGVVDCFSNKIDAYAVYEKVDSKEYKKEEIEIKDNTNIPFITDKNVIGFWECVDYVHSFDEYEVGKKFWSEELLLKSYTFNPNGDLMVQFNTRDDVYKINWSKGVVINKNISTVSEYVVKQINNETIMYIEWKSGDYVYGGEVYGYYVFKKVK